MIDTLKDVNDLERVKTLFNELLDHIGITYEEFKEIGEEDLTYIIGEIQLRQ
jgi:hypothetical protein